MNIGYVNTKMKNVSNFLRDRYGITLDELKILCDKQKGKCAMCGLETKLLIDHKHDTRIVRGLLCSKCNSGLHYVENKEFIKLAQKYLKRQTR